VFRPPALIADRNDAIERRTRALESKRPLDLDAVARAVRHIRRPDVLAARLGDAIRYSQRVEADVAGLSIHTLLPHATDDYDARFLAVWVPDESGHGRALDLLLARLGLPSYAGRDDDAVPVHNRVAGLLGRLVPHAYEMVSMAYHAVGAINERLALAAYTRMGTIADELGETRLAEALLAPLRRDESGHLGYYRTYARQLRPRLAGWQMAIVRALIVRTYAPVGAGDAPDKAPFGRAVLQLEADPENPEIARAVHGIAVELLAREHRSLPPFVLASLRECVRLAGGAARDGQPTLRAAA
jgi:hypothetical protein